MSTVGRVRAARATSFVHPIVPRQAPTPSGTTMIARGPSAIHRESTQNAIVPVAIPSVVVAVAPAATLLIPVARTVASTATDQSEVASNASSAPRGSEIPEERRTSRLV